MIQPSIHSSTNPIKADVMRCREWIEAALEHAGDTHDYWDIVEGIYENRMQLWAGEQGCLVTEIVVYPKKKVLNIFLGGGELQALADMHGDIISWAKQQGCSGASICGRKGWVRAFKKYGWRPKFTVITKEFDK